MNSRWVIFIVACVAWNAASAIEPLLRDPTLPLGYAVTKQVEKVLVLQAILNRNGQKKAIINDKSLSSGETIEGAVIVNISDKEVVFRRNGKSGVLVLRPSIR